MLYAAIYETLKYTSLYKPICLFHGLIKHTHRKHIRSSLVVNQ